MFTVVSHVQIKSKMKYYTTPVKMTFSKIIKAFIQVPQTQKQWDGGTEIGGDSAE